MVEELTGTGPGLLISELALAMELPFDPTEDTFVGGLLTLSSLAISLSAWCHVLLVVVLL